MKINVPYNFGDTVYMKDDPYQDPCTIIEIILLPEGANKLVLSHLGERYIVYDFETTKEKDLTKTFQSPE